jgi:phage-related protein
MHQLRLFGPCADVIEARPSAAGYSETCINIQILEYSATMPKPMPRLKPLTFLGSSRDDLREMPAAVRHAIGVELMTVQFGGIPTDFKPIASVGAGAYEIRVRDVAGAFRTVYVTKFDDSIYVLHAFQKKTQKTAKADLDLARRRYKLIPGAKP